MRVCLMDCISTFLRRVKNWRVHAYHISLRTVILFRVVLECLGSGDHEKVAIGKRIIRSLKLDFSPVRIRQEDPSRDGIKVMRDEDGYPYVHHFGERLYLKKRWDREECLKYYASIRSEQDGDSPHRYFNGHERYPDRQDIVADIGAAEGNFGLEVVGLCKKVYLFEYDDEWMMPLKKTFSKWGDKVEIIKKYVGETDDDARVRLDSFFADREVSFIKADIEGAEEEMLYGGGGNIREEGKKGIDMHIP